MRIGARALGVALLLLLVAGASPLAAADHTFAHRYVIYGKVVDARGWPVPNLTVEMRYDPAKTAFAPEETILQEQQAGTRTDAFGPTLTRQVTNEHGEFMFAYHVHGISQSLPGTYFLGAEKNGNISFKQEFPFDPRDRVDFPLIQLDHQDPDAVPDTGFYTVEGRFFVTSPTVLSGVDGAPGPQYGHTIDNAPVNVSFTHDGATEKLRTTTNNYGDFAIRVRLNASVSSGTITVESNGVTRTQAYDPKVGVSSFKVDVPAPPDPFFQQALLVLGVIVVLGAVIGGGVWGYQRMSARREAEAVRATAVRKRSR